MKKTALIVGMAKSGISSAKLLYRNGYNIIINDMKPVIPGLEEALSGIEYTDKLGEAPETLLDGVDLMIISPVIPIFAPFVRKAQSRGIEVIGEIELGYRYCSRGTHFVCIGGTNGKPQPLRLPAKYSKQTAKAKRLFSATSAFQLPNMHPKRARATPLLRKPPRSSSKASVTFMPMQPGF